MKTLTELRIRMLERAYTLKYSHMPSALSALPIIAEIFRTKGPDDVFVLSKGHGAYALYAVLEEYGIYPEWEHHEPQRNPEKGVVCTTGSLGHGLPVAAGIAFAKKLKGEPGTVHVLLGDGECAEGTTWESLLFIDRFLDITRIKIHVDYNSYQAISKTIYSIELPCRLGQYMWFYHFMKGFGIPLFENNPECHVKPISKDEYNKAMEDLLCVQSSEKQ